MKYLLFFCTAELHSSRYVMDLVTHCAAPEKKRPKNISVLTPLHTHAHTIPLKKQLKTRLLVWGLLEWTFARLQSTPWCESEMSSLVSSNISVRLTAPNCTGEIWAVTKRHSARVWADGRKNVEKREFNKKKVKRGGKRTRMSKCFHFQMFLRLISCLWQKKIETNCH